MSNRKHMTIVRNAGYTVKEFNTRERHNERKNEFYYIGDIEISRVDKNIDYQRYVYPDGTPETYHQYTMYNSKKINNGS